MLGNPCYHPREESGAPGGPGSHLMGIRHPRNVSPLRYLSRCAPGGIPGEILIAPGEGGGEGIMIGYGRGQRRGEEQRMRREERGRAILRA